MQGDTRGLALAYLEAVGRKEFDKVDALLARDVTFTGPDVSRATAEGHIRALKRLSVIHVRNELKRVFVDGDEVCLIYDFVTDTPVGTRPTIEWLRIRGGRIRCINLYYDRLPWRIVLNDLHARYPFDRT